MTSKDSPSQHHRWVVERTFAWISIYRRCVRECERRIASSEAMIMLMSRRLTH